MSARRSRRRLIKFACVVESKRNYRGPEGLLAELVATAREDYLSEPRHPLAVRTASRSCGTSSRSLRPTERDGPSQKDYGKDDLQHGDQDELGAAPLSASPFPDLLQQRWD